MPVTIEQVKVVAEVLKGKFKQLTVMDTIELSEKIVAALNELPK